MWIANACLFKSGGPRISANFAGMQASCGDATVIPYKTRKINFTVGCYGCRSAGELGDCEMYVGLPVEQIEELAANLKGLKRAMMKLEEKSN